MSARPQLVLVLVLVVLAVLVGVFVWSGFGTGEGLSSGDPSVTTRRAGNLDQEAGALQGGTGIERRLVGESRRENVEAQPGTAAAPRVELFGRLVRSQGTPAAGVTLRLLQAEEQLVRAGRVPDPGDAPAVQTDADGRFRLLAKSGTMGALSLDGFETVFQRGNGRSMVVQIGKESRDLGDLVILAAARVSGQVVDAGGRPVAGVSVTASEGDSLWNLVLGEGNRTGKDGRFELRGLRPGKQRLLARSPEHLPAEQEVELVEGQHREGILIRVEPGGFILGTVVDDLGQPIAGAEVAASRTQEVDTQIKVTTFSPGESTHTDGSGRFRLANLNTKTAQLRVSHRGFDTQMVRDVVVGITDLVVELKRLGAIEGVLVDEDNQPVQGSTVSASRSGGTLLAGDMIPGFGSSGTVTNAAGGFRLENVQPGNVLVTARSEMHLPARQRVQVHPGETTRGLRLVATPGTILVVTVQDAAGQPVPDAEVTVKEKDRDGGIRIPSGGDRRGVRRLKIRADVDIRRDRNGPPALLGAGNTLGEGRTDASGKVTIGGLPACAVVVSARHDELALVNRQELLLPERGKAISLLHMRRGGFLLVSAVDATGKPMAKAKFTVTSATVGNDGEDRGQEETCDGEGKARLGPLSPGDYTAALLGEQRPQIRGGMSFTWAGSESILEDSRVRVQIREGDTNEVVLRRPVLTTVKGSVRDRSVPVKGARVALLEEGAIRLPFGSGLEAYTDEGGLFEISGVPSGKYTLSWGRRSAVVPSEDEIQLQKDQLELVRHLVIPGAVVRLKTWGGEAAVEDAEVTLSRMTAGAGGQGPERRQAMFRMISITNQGSGPQRVDMSAGARSAHTDEEGQVVIKDVPPGRYALSIRHRQFATHREEIDIPPDTTLDLGTRKLTSGGSVSGSILFEESNQVQMALVQITTWDGKNTERTVATEGRFHFSGLATGKYKVRARRIGGNAGAPWGPEETVEVEPDRTARTKLKLP